jgi:hypothetical protein
MVWPSIKLLASCICDVIAVRKSFMTKSMLTILELAHLSMLRNRHS